MSVSTESDEEGENRDNVTPLATSLTNSVRKRPRSSQDFFD